MGTPVPLVHIRGSAIPKASPFYGGVAPRELPLTVSPPSGCGSTTYRGVRGATSASTCTTSPSGAEHSCESLVLAGTHSPHCPVPPVPTCTGKEGVTVQHMPCCHPDKEPLLHLILTRTSSPQDQRVLVHPVGIELCASTQCHLPRGHRHSAGHLPAPAPLPIPQPHLCPERGGICGVRADGDGVEGVLGLDAVQGDIGTAA